MDLKEIDKSEFRNVLLALICHSDALRYNENCLELFEEIPINRDEIYKFLEYLLISDESASIRSSAALVLYQNFSKESLNPLIWAIQHEKSASILNTIDKMIATYNTSQTCLLRSVLDKQLASIYKVDSNEGRFLLELDALKKKVYMAPNYKLLIKNNHVIALEIPGWHLKELPSSIGNLKKLKLLNLWDNNLSSLPSSLGNLEQLESLYLDWNRFSALPPFLAKMKSLKKISLMNNSYLQEIPDLLLKLSERTVSKNYVDEGVKEKDAIVLGLLQILTGQKLKLLKNKESLSPTCACHYMINAKGRVIGLYIYGYYFFQIPKFPKQICDHLTFLEEIVIRDQNMHSVPNSLKNLQYLKKIDLMKNQFHEIPRLLLEMESLAVIDFSYNSISRIPDEFLAKNAEVWF